ncbi:MAG: hypothetical protein ACE5EQ_00545 [Phycisphaerae bacterium]
MGSKNLLSSGIAVDGQPVFNKTRFADMRNGFCFFPGEHRRPAGASLFLLPFFFVVVFVVDVFLVLPDNHTETRQDRTPLVTPKCHTPLVAPKGRNMSAQGRAKRLISRAAPPWVSSHTHTQP